jgi:hypothetical protein
MDKNTRLPRNFHKSFKPERHYITALLRFSASGNAGNFEEIADATGIPMGSSSGKVPAILDYCRAMGLITLGASSERSSIKHPVLTNFGRVVLLEDPFLKCEITQWLAHFNMCSPIIGADVWYYTFFEGVQSLGVEFKREQLERYLSMVYGLQKTNIIGPIIGMYAEDASFRSCSALAESNGIIAKKAAPIQEELFRGYGAWILQLLKDNFPNQRQIPITDLDKKAGWKVIPGWSISSAIYILDLLEQKGLILVDRHMEPWLIQARISCEQAWNDIYIDMI